MTTVHAYGRSAAWVVMTGLILALGGTAVGLLALVDRGRTATGTGASLSYLPKGEYLRLASVGYRQLVADLLWLQVVQQIGVRNQTTDGYLWIYHATDTLTDLDPQFAYAYQAVGSVLGVWGGRPHESVAILRKGIEHNPTVWELPFFLGYDYFYELQDLASAAVAFKRAAELPGAPKYLPGLTARMLVQAGNPEAALEFLQRLYQQTQDERAKSALTRRMADVTVERDLRLLEDAVRRYRAAQGRWPKALEDLVTAGLLARLPEDPGGGAYELNASDGSVTSTRVRDRMKVYRAS
jgi:tetratricopeptide (TPR) repeat protein